MKTIVYPAKFYIVDVLFCIVGLASSIIVPFYLDENTHFIIWIFYGVLIAITLIDFFFILWDIQWINIDNENVCARNIFGIIKKINLSSIQTIKERNARAWGIKMHSTYYPCIVISSCKTINTVKDSYNHKKSNYIIFPNTNDNLQTIQDAINNQQVKSQK